MKVIHSVGVKLAGGGFGNTAYHAVRGAYRHGVLHRVIALGAAKTEIDEAKVKRIGYPLPLRATGRLLPAATFYTLKDGYFDRMAERYVEPCDIFHGWPNMMTRSARKARELGAAIVVIGSSSHPNTQVRLLKEEYAQYGVNLHVMSDISFRRISEDLREADLILAASEFVRNSLLEAGIGDSKISLVPFGVDLERFCPAEVEDDGVFRALFVGQVCLRKGVQYLLAAWDKLGLARAELILAGPLSQDIADIVRPYQRRSDIRFLGLVRDPVPLYQRASVFVFPSIEEGSALVTYEAMACGLPVIVSENSGSVARDGLDGFVIPIRDVDAIGDRLYYFYMNEGERRRMGSSAQSHVEQYTWERYGDAVVEAYRRLLGA